MLRNYLKTALRNLVRYKSFTLINIASLAIGLAGCLVIGLFVWDEVQYDQFFKNGENIYRAYTKRSSNTADEATASVSPMFATYLQQQYPEVEMTTRLLMWQGKMLMESGEIKSYEERGLIADSTFFSLFPLTFLQGDANTALTGPTSVVITEELAKKYFGNTNAVGKIIKLDKSDFAVKGVLANIPEHFHLEFNYIVPMSAAGLPPERLQRWSWQQFFTYIKVKPGTNIERLQEKFQAAVKKEADPGSEKSGFTYKPYFQSLKDIHLYSSEFVYDNAKRGNGTYVKGLTIIALFVLAIACFNFINLATARSFRRAKEIGVRKVIGADRGQLVLQFTGETILLALISISIAAVVTVVVLPSLNSFTGKHITFNPLAQPIITPLLLAAGLLVGILAGIYPAVVLSGFQPIKVLKGLKITGDGHSRWLREALVVVQFALSALLIVSTIIVFRQINYLHNKELGFNKEQIMYFPLRADSTADLEAFKDELKRSPNVVSVTAGYGLPGDQLAGDGIIVPGKDGDKEYSANLFIVDHDYIRTLGLKLVAGRDFSKDMATDVDEAFIINETAVRELGFGTPEKALGQRLNWQKWQPDSLRPVKKGRVIGIVKDFHYKSLHEKVSTSVLQIYPPVVVKMAVKLRTADLKNTLAFITGKWNSFSPGYPLDYKFMDENFSAMYQSEDKLKTLLTIFTAMAILVGCMGLFGLAAFSAEQRTKEIGIRKVLGASVMNIATMLSAKFLKPVVLASLVAFPLAWWAMSRWLENFPYRITISWWIFGLAALAAFLVALITVSFQSLRAATSNPVKSLRTE